MATELPNNDAQADPLVVDEGYEADSFTGNDNETIYATTISSYIRDGIEENGRKYAAYGKHAYGLPVDEREQERNGKHLPIPSIPFLPNSPLTPRPPTCQIHHPHQ
jgi:hypothetical protein